MAGSECDVRPCASIQRNDICMGGFTDAAVKIQEH